MIETNEAISEEFSDEEGENAIAWQELPSDRDFFASPYDPPIKSLVQEIREGELIVRPTFQRNQVWDATRKSRFVESILLNIPIPTLFFADDEDKKVVVDGQQRLLALKEFVENRFPMRGLEVLAPLNGKRFDDLSERQQRIINNRTLRCLVISAKSDSEIRFQVFERLNQGGMPLNAQEVRHCVYRGELNDLLHELSRNQTWLQIYGRDDRHPRMVDCELILRFFAIHDALPNYSPPLKKILTDYMRDHRHIDDVEKDQLQTRFFRAVEGVNAVFADHPFRRVRLVSGNPEYDRNLNRAIFDIQMIMSELVPLEWLTENRDRIRDCFQALCINDDTFADSVSRATADKKRFDYRLNVWATSLTELGAQISAPHLIPDRPEA
ncbi:DUF262 domain-containing protein [Pelagibius sp.]|uniref:DUF262 domain-containing protein n=1 Tax=Pelagibius sp. TaxID=1931238 RepID=UPI002629A8D7|nr:DUF262 domain-containing protein [Pelagibius sp.]